MVSVGSGPEVVVSDEVTRRMMGSLENGIDDVHGETECHLQLVARGTTATMEGKGEKGQSAMIYAPMCRGFKGRKGRQIRTRVSTYWEMFLQEVWECV
jgi:hypothetical protein